MARAFITVGFATMCVAGGLLVSQPTAAEWFKDKIIHSIKESCPKCEVEVGRVELSLSILKGQIAVEGFKYADSPDRRFRVTIQAKKLELQTKVMSWLRKPIVIEKFRGEGVDFTAFENPDIPSAKDNSPPLSQLAPMIIEHVEIVNSTFRYTHLVHPEASTLLLTEINGTVGAWSTRPDLAKQFSPEETPIYATGRLEASGRFVLKAHADALSKLGTANIYADVKDQPLEKVSEFFQHEQGIRLKGQVHNVSTNLQMTNGKIKGTLQASYSGLEVKVEDPKSSRVSNFISTLGVAIVKQNEQGTHGAPQVAKPVEGKRSPDQGIIEAIFQALGTAATKLMKG